MNIPSNTRELAVNFAAAALLGALNIIYAISFASLLFSGELAAFIPVGVGLFLLSNALSALILAVTCSIPGVIATFKGNIVAIMAVMVAAIATTTAPNQVLATVVAAISASSVAAGIFLLFLGWLKLGNLIRFIPYPVMAGFFAGTGLLIVKGAVPVMMEIPLTPENLILWFKSENLLLWCPGLLVGLLLLKIETRVDNPLAIPLALVLAMGLFYALLFVTGTTVEQARSMGLLFHGFSLSGFFPPIGPHLWQNVDVSALTGQYGTILSIVLISPILCLILISAIEVGTGKEVNLERDLKAAGAANIFLGLFGGAVSFHTAADTVLSYRLGAKTAAVGVFFAGISALCLIVGPNLIALLPKFIMGGLLLYQGLGFIIDWAYRSKHQMPWLDYFLVLIILFTVASLGFVKGVIAGILIATVFFVVNYSRTSVFRHIFHATNIRSRVDRSLPHQKRLREKGEAILILSLQGYIFFGSAYKILSRIRGWPGVANGGRIQFILLDFHWVTDIDISAVNILLKLKQFTDSNEITLIFSNLNDQVKAKLNLANGFAKDEKLPGYMQFSDLDHALEWCEDRILSAELYPKKQDPSLEEHLKAWFSTSEMVARFTGYLEFREFDAEETLFRQGDPSDSLYILISGKINIYTEGNDGKGIRLLMMRSGSIMGEMGLYTSRSRTASAKTETPCRVAILSAKSFNRMQEEEPKVAAELHKFIIDLLSNRIARADKMLKMLIP